VFGLCQIHSFIDYLRANLSRENFNSLFKTLATIVAGIVGIGLAVLTLSGKVNHQLNQLDLIDED
jgi:dolichyl-diphosphooligosaccharide--protein glycosyltransferase